MLTSHDVALVVFNDTPVDYQRDGCEAVYLCPSCRTPNLQVHLASELRGLWHCWACGTGGRVVLPLSAFPQASLKSLHRRVGRQAPRFSGADLPLMASEAARRAISGAILAYSDLYPSRLYDRPAMSLPCGRRGWLSRMLDGWDPRYMRSPGRDLYLHDRGRIPRAWRRDCPVYVIESALDVLRWLTVMHERGLEVYGPAGHVVALNGLAIGPQSAGWLQMRPVVWLLDNDPPGREAAERHSRNFPNSRVYETPKNWPKAPGDWHDEHWNWFLAQQPWL